MKRKYEVVYYEHGLTKVNRKRFFTLVAAFFYAQYIEHKHGKNAMTTIGERVYE